MRLKKWDYRNDGHYFVTMITKNREPHFGEIIRGEMLLSAMGNIAEEELLKTGNNRENVFIDEFCIMPDHVHCIVIISDMEYDSPVSCRRAGRPLRSRVARYATTGDTGSALLSPRPGSLSAVIRAYKSAVTRRCRESGYEQFAWQPRFYDRIIRDQDELNNVRRYIRNNVKKWEINRGEGKDRGE
ncbi:MAG TPA: transposase [Spirochaetota bacterium]|nr:transposase [Spirochaetota bacterium]HPI89316.1 transposase [Spirochaetota bacterium]